MGPVALAIILCCAFVVGAALARRLGQDADGRGAAALAGVMAVAIVPMVVTPLLVTSDPERMLVCRLEASPRSGRPDGTGQVTRPRACEVLERGRAVTFRLRSGAIESTGGTTLRIVPQGISGYVDAFEVVRGRPRISGWAADVADGRPATAVLLFSGRRFVGAVKPTVRRPDVVDVYDRDGLEQSGFGVDLPQRTWARRPLLAFGVEGGVASRLVLDCASREHLELGCP